MLVAMPTAMPEEPLTSREHTGLLPALVEVGVPVDGVLVDIPEHLVGDPGHFGLGVTVGRGGVAVDGAEVAVAEDQGIAHGEVLGQTDHGVVYGGVAVGVIPAQHVAHAGGGLLQGLVIGQVVLVHGIQDTPVHGLETVPHVGQRPVDDDRHGVFDKGAFHLLDQFTLYNFLIRVSDLLRIVVFFSFTSQAAHLP
jgi:hypothetical protein